MAPEPASGDTGARHHETFAEHEHAKEPRAKGHAYDVMRLCGPNQTHQGLCHHQGEEQIEEKPPEAVQVGQEDYKNRAEHGNQCDARQVCEEICENVGSAGDLNGGMNGPFARSLRNTSRISKKRGRIAIDMNTRNACT